MSDTNSEPQSELKKDVPPQQDAEANLPPEEIIKRLEVELAEAKDGRLRIAAEMENLRKRLERERTDERKYAISRFVKDITPVADNLARALKAVTAEQRDNPSVRGLLDGVELTERELLAVLERNGVRRIVPKGEPFNPNFHQAVAEIQMDGATPGSVIEVIEPGYVLEDRLVRPALVVIAKAGAAPAGATVDTKA
ncbi:MAG: nucleotide exchange factor GrpE [Alphaproteobacteria bacterium]